jgi:NAD(P)-dependent dehydrogenase (short-subunit alcohol dehydrogenase family)
VKVGRIEGKIVFIAGGALGPGEAIARRFAAEGASVITTGAEFRVDGGSPM